MLSRVLEYGNRVFAASKGLLLIRFVCIYL